MIDFSVRGNNTEFILIRIKTSYSSHLLRWWLGNLLVLKNRFLKQRQKVKRKKERLKRIILQHPSVFFSILLWFQCKHEVADCTQSGCLLTFPWNIELKKKKPEKLRFSLSTVSAQRTFKEPWRDPGWRKTAILSLPGREFSYLTIASCFLPEFSQWAHGSELLK